MRIIFRARSFTVTPAIRAYTERRLLSALGRFDGPISEAVVRFTDLNGPRGGVDKHCRLEARFRRGGQLAVEDVHIDMFAAIDRATGRLGRSVARVIARQREMASGAPRHGLRSGTLRGITPPPRESGAAQEGGR